MEAPHAMDQCREATVWSKCRMMYWRLFFYVCSPIQRDAMLEDGFERTSCMIPRLS